MLLLTILATKSFCANAPEDEEDVVSAASGGFSLKLVSKEQTTRNEILNVERQKLLGIAKAELENNISVGRSVILQEEFTSRVLLCSEQLLNQKHAFMRMVMSEAGICMMMPLVGQGECFQRDLAGAVSEFERLKNQVSGLSTLRDQLAREKEEQQRSIESFKKTQRNILSKKEDGRLDTAVQIYAPNSLNNDDEHLHLLRHNSSGTSSLDSIQKVLQDPHNYAMFKRMFVFGFVATCCDLTSNVFKLHQGNDYAKDIVISSTWFSHITRDVSTLYGVFYATEKRGFKDIYRNFRKYFCATHEKESMILAVSIILTGMAVLSDIFYLSSLYDPATTAGFDTQFHSNLTREGLLYTSTVLNFLSSIHVHLNHESLEVL